MKSKTKKFHLQIVSFLIVLTLCSTGCIQKQSNQKVNQQATLSLSPSDLTTAYNLSVNWLLSNLKDKGIFQYIYNPITDTYPAKNNMIRQLMASRVLADLAKHNQSLLPVHQQNLNFIFTYWYQETHDYGYILYNDKSKLGAMAMTLRTLVHSPIYETYEEKAKKIANTILFLQNENGSFNPWYIKPSYDYDSDYLLTFYSGEALLSLIEFYNLTKNTTYLHHAIQGQHYYLNKYVTNLADNYYPAYVPWHTMSLYELFILTNNKTYATAILTLNDKLLELQDTTNLPTMGRFYNASTPYYGSPHSSSDAVYTESLALAYKTASILNDNYHMKKYKKAIVLSLHNLLNLQYHQKNEKIQGALKYNTDDSRIRVDTTQHFIDALNKINPLFKTSHKLKISYYENTIIKIE